MVACWALLTAYIGFASSSAKRTGELLIKKKLQIKKNVRERNNTLFTTQHIQSTRTVITYATTHGTPDMNKIKKIMQIVTIRRRWLVLPPLIVKYACNTFGILYA